EFYDQVFYGQVDSYEHNQQNPDDLRTVSAGEAWDGITSNRDERPPIFPFPYYPTEFTATYRPGYYAAHRAQNVVVTNGQLLPRAQWMDIQEFYEVVGNRSDVYYAGINNIVVFEPGKCTYEGMNFGKATGGLFGASAAEEAS